MNIRLFVHICLHVAYPNNESKRRDQGDERVTDAESHSGLGRARNMKVCVVVSKSRL
jgi:hypothetical protein